MLQQCPRPLWAKMLGGYVNCMARRRYTYTSGPYASAIQPLTSQHPSVNLCRRTFNPSIVTYLPISTSRSRSRHFHTTPKMPQKLSQSDLPNKIRMMVLETDEPHPNTRETQGSFGDVLDSLFKKAGDAHDPPLGIETSMHFVVEPKGGRVPDVSEFEDVHALLITGSMADAHGDEEWILKLVRLLRGMFYSSCFSPLDFCFSSASSERDWGDEGKDWRRKNDTNRTERKLTHLLTCLSQIYGFRDRICGSAGCVSGTRSYAGCWARQSSRRQAASGSWRTRRSN